MCVCVLVGASNIAVNKGIGVLVEFKQSDCSLFGNLGICGAEGLHNNLQGLFRNGNHGDSSYLHQCGLTTLINVHFHILCPALEREPD